MTDVPEPASPPLKAEHEVFLNRLEDLRRSHPANLCARYLNRGLFLSFGPHQREALYRCCKSGAENPDSLIGCYILHPGDLDEFREFFEPVIRDYHGRHAAPETVETQAKQASLDPGSPDLSGLSVRVRVARTLKGFRMPGSMDRPERIQLEKAMTQSLRRLIDDKRYGGRICSLTPEFGPGEHNQNRITWAEYQDLVKAGIMFRDMDADPYLKSAGIAGDWPYGRACYVSRDREVIVWVGEEDHLRIMCIPKGASLTDAFQRLRDVVAVIAALPGMEFAYDGTFGYINSCPSNLGTGMRASVQLAMPHLVRAGIDVNATCRRLGLSACGAGGERTKIESDGVFQISPRRRLFSSESETRAALFEGIRQLTEFPGSAPAAG